MFWGASECVAITYGVKSVDAGKREGRLFLSVCPSLRVFYDLDILPLVDEIWS